MHTREIASPAVQHLTDGLDEMLLRDDGPAMVKCLKELGDAKLEDILELTVADPGNAGLWGNS